MIAYSEIRKAHKLIARANDARCECGQFDYWRKRDGGLVRYALPCVRHALIRNARYILGVSA